jgi:hypothetical protein
MGKMSIGFHENEGRVSSINIDNYRGKWVILFLRSGGSWGGKLNEIGERNFGLLPYLKQDYSMGQPEYRIQEKGLPRMIDRFEVVNVEESSELGMKGYCEHMNRTIRRSEILADFDFRSKIPWRPIEVYQDGAGI